MSPAPGTLVPGPLRPLPETADVQRHPAEAERGEWKVLKGHRVVRMKGKQSWALEASKGALCRGPRSRYTQRELMLGVTGLQREGVRTCLTGSGFHYKRNNGGGQDASLAALSPCHCFWFPRLKEALKISL